MDKKKLILFFFIAEKQSLYLIYMTLSKPVDLPGIHRFSAMSLLDDRQIDYYNSQDRIDIPKQQWMKEKIPNYYWEKNTHTLRNREKSFIVDLNILMEHLNHSESDLHVLQERYGCEVEQQGDDFNFSKGFDEFGYDGEDFLHFDLKEAQWVASVEAAELTKKNWNNDPSLNQYTKGYLEKECVYWLNTFREYADEELRNCSLPDVHVFARKSTKDKSKLKLTCVATGFFHKDVMMVIRKYRSSLPDDEIECTGVWPNHDGSYQMRKSVEIKEDDKAEYDCFVAHNTLKEPVFKKWDGKCRDCPPETVSVIIAAVIGAVLLLSVVALVVFILKKKRTIGQEREMMSDSSSTGSVSSF